MNKLIMVPLVALIFVLIDIYVYQAVKVVFDSSSLTIRRTVSIVYWGVTCLTMLSFFTYQFFNVDKLGRVFTMFLLTGIFINYFTKIFVILFLLVDDFVRLGKWAFREISQLFSTKPETVATAADNAISRSEFLMKTGLIVSAVPFLGMTYGIISGAHDYRIRRKTITLKNLPKSFDGFKIAQISDIHSGSFFNKTAVKGGVDMLLREKADVVFFTGDLVNNRSNEIKEYFDIFKNVKAPMGVYSTLGNHDYGEYVSWPSREARIQNLKDLIIAHKELGWNLLMNEHRFLSEGTDKLAIIGIENWGTGRWPKYGKMDQAYQGTQDAPVKLLLSHDPSHWNAQVRKDYQDIDITFAGHTHGFQFGIEVGDLKWSPAKYAYKQWAGLYKEDNQYLYVNRGYGYLGFPGRIGMPPEITIIELKRG